MDERLQEMLEQGLLSPAIALRLRGARAVAVASGPNAEAIARATRPVRVVSLAGPGERVVHEH